jgi:hypothetical protein
VSAIASDVAFAVSIETEWGDHVAADREIASRIPGRLSRRETLQAPETRQPGLGHHGRERRAATVDDAKAYTKPWTVTEAVRLQLDTELLEFICNENNRDLEHLPGESLK